MGLKAFNTKNPMAQSKWMILKVEYRDEINSMSEV